ncbi:MAG: L,D-transpeptidase family protein [Hyphomicrobiaceae bacterium]|nr:L,D-transpeptidase family protein [Hyphomicrobiaceae bacterium]
MRQLGIAAIAAVAIHGYGMPALALEPDPPQRLLSADEAVAIGVRSSLSATARNLSDGDKSDRSALAAFYVTRENKPMWLDGKALTAKAKALIDEIKRADDWGLDAADFDLPPTDLGADPGTDVLVDAETRISIAALKYARFARGGRIPDPRQMSSYLDRDPPILSPVKVLEGLTNTDDPGGYLVNLQPKHDGFEHLRKKLIELRQAEKTEQPVIMPATGPLLAPGKKHADVVILRQRLKAELPPAAADGTPADPEFYDETLETAVKAYQRENGMTTDGLVGRNTRASLNGGKRKIDEGLLIANMEEWRWMPEDLGRTYVWVNLPEYLVRVIKDGKLIHEERIIAGQTDKQTPVFSHELETVVLHPYWAVPESIKVKELLPSLARGSSLERRGLRLQYNGRDVDPLSVDWSRADIRAYNVYQPPGGGNVLGNVKFLFPNKHQVYMHDTPTKGLFSESTRTFSHGCMRVRNPMRLAEIVLEQDKGWSADKVQTLLAKGPNDNNIKLDSKIPVHVTYFTAWVDDAGELHSRPDMYQHEKRIRLALAGQWDRIPRHRDHLLPVPYVRPQIVATQGGGSSNALNDFFGNLFGGF